LFCHSRRGNSDFTTMENHHEKHDVIVALSPTNDCYGFESFSAVQ
ncbi:MAG: hypothetical protein ACI9SC_000090, partial [Gammaproteobacteria bacterium]